MTISKFGAVIVTGAVMFAGLHAPAFAASPMTDAFLANLTPNVDFLDRSSRFALTNSKNAKVKDFAMSEAREQTKVANAIDSYIDGTKQVAAADADGIVTGRSVAIDGQPATRSAPADRMQIVDERLPMGEEDLNRLEGLSGKEFDDLYWQKQVDALKQVETDYSHYIMKGDDPILLKMASTELPKIRKRLAAISKL